MNEMSKDLGVIGPLIESISRLFNMTPEQMQADFERHREQARRRVAARNAKYRAAMQQVTELQAVVIEKLECQGAKLQNKLWENRRTGNVALMMIKEAWDGKKMTMGCKLIMVYPDGSVVQTMEKSISIKQNF